MRSAQLVLVVVLLVGASILLFGLPRSQTIHPPGLTTNRTSFGSSGIGNVGWLMPSNILISTSYVANQSVSRFLVGNLNVFPYQITPGTVLYLSLYLNSHLASTQEYDVSSFYKTRANLVGIVKNGIATFTDTTVGFTVSDFPLSATLPVGTMMTVTVWVSNPVWVQIDETIHAHSYETSALASYSPPSVVVPEAGIISPHTLSVGLETSAA